MQGKFLFQQIVTTLVCSTTLASTAGMENFARAPYCPILVDEIQDVFKSIQGEKYMAMSETDRRFCPTVVNDLRETVKKLAVPDIQLRLSQAEKRVKWLEEKCEALVRRERTEKEDHAAEKQKLQSLISQAEKEKDKLVGESQTIQSQIIQAETEKLKLTSESQALQSRLNQAETEKQKLSVEKQTLQSRLSQSELEKQKLAAEKQALQSQIIQAETDKQKLTSESQALQSRLSQAETEKQKLSVEKQTLQSRLSQSELEKQKLAAEKQALQSQIIQAETDKQKLTSESQALQSRLSQSELEKQKLAAEKQALQSQISQAVAEKQKLTAESQTVQAQLSQAENLYDQAIISAYKVCQSFDTALDVLKNYMNFISNLPNIHQQLRLYNKLVNTLNVTANDPPNFVLDILIIKLALSTANTLSLLREKVQKLAKTEHLNWGLAIKSNKYSSIVSFCKYIKCEKIVGDVIEAAYDATDNVAMRFLEFADELNFISPTIVVHLTVHKKMKSAGLLQHKPFVRLAQQVKYVLDMPNYKNVEDKVITKQHAELYLKFPEAMRALIEGKDVCLTYNAFWIWNPTTKTYSKSKNEPCTFPPCKISPFQLRFEAGTGDKKYLFRMISKEKFRYGNFLNENHTMLSKVHISRVEDPEDGHFWRLEDIDWKLGIFSIYNTKYDEYLEVNSFEFGATHREGSGRNDQTSWTIQTKC